MNYGFDTSYTSYGAGGAGGGGFIPGEGSQQSPSGRKEFAQETLRPVTIKQLHDAQQIHEQEITIDGSPISQLTFVGQIRNISNLTTNITYKLDDGTGSIEVKLWVNPENADGPNSSRAKLEEGAYCRVWGKLKIFNGKKHVSSHILRPVEDYNEISYHFLEATYVHLYLTRGPPGGAAASGGAALNGGYGQQAGGGDYGGTDLGSFSAVAKKVFKHLRETPQTNEGLHQQDIAAQLGIDVADVARAGDDLLAGGLIYTTVDDQTWAVLEAD
ncbi:replication protein A, subunit RPA32 [Lojkania enalia]|uniref:Replication protein A, subunit RPA32 n=1 Tax=Lojkania enalia TaxID=147567 RepID=A0A9P4KI71_9PLEO|nr:replication protein A, subunit RPA32 [Didymosphaeria enalia]